VFLSTSIIPNIVPLATELEYMALAGLNVAVLSLQDEGNLDTDSQVVYGPSPGIHDLIKKKGPVGIRDRAKRKGIRLEKF